MKKEKSAEGEVPRSRKPLVWAVKMSFLTFLLAGTISVCADLLTNGASIWAILLILLALIAVGSTSDTIGTAFASATISPFIAMSSRKIRGAKECVWLLKKAEKVTSICCDVIGDICGVVSGAAAAALVIFLLSGGDNLWVEAFCSAMVSALTVGSKALGKTIAMKRSKDIVYLVGYFFSFFRKQDRNNAGTDSFSGRRA